MAKGVPKGYRALRRGRFSEPGRIYLLTTVTQGREPTFQDLYLGRQVVCSIARLQAEGRAATWAYILMPDHLHWLMQLPEGGLPGRCHAGPEGPFGEAGQSVAGSTRTAGVARGVP